jgi:hypothetical protein
MDALPMPLCPQESMPGRALAAAMVSAAMGQGGLSVGTVRILTRATAMETGTRSGAGFVGRRITMGLITKAPKSLTGWYRHRRGLRAPI